MTRDEQISRNFEVYYYMAEFMDEHEQTLKQHGMSVRYDTRNDKVTIHTKDGEGGVFDLTQFLCSSDPVQFFKENF